MAVRWKRTLTPTELNEALTLYLKGRGDIAEGDKVQVIGLSGGLSVNIVEPEKKVEDKSGATV